MQSGGQKSNAHAAVCNDVVMIRAFTGMSWEMALRIQVAGAQKTPQGAAAVQLPAVPRCSNAIGAQYLPKRLHMHNINRIK